MNEHRPTKELPTILAPLALLLLAACAGDAPPAGTGPAGAAASAASSSAPGAADADPCAGLPAKASFVVARAPHPGTVTALPIEVTGCSSTFESNVVWRLLRRNGTVAAEGFTSGGGVDGPRPFHFTIDSVSSSSGLHHLEVSEPVVSEEEGFPPGRTVLPLFLELPPASTPAAPTSLAEAGGGEWRLVSLGPELPLPEGIQITATIAEGTIAGASGCNRYTGNITLSEDGVLSVGPIAGTRMACPPPGGDIEPIFLRALEGARSLRLEDGQLILDGQSEGAGPLTFARAGAAGSGEPR